MRKGFAGILVLIVVLIAAVAAGAYYLGIQKSGGNTLVQSPSPSPTPDEIASWKTYTSKSYGYSVRYPETWYLYESENAPTTVGLWVEKTDGEAVGAWIFVRDNPTGLILQKWWEEDIKKYSDYEALINQTTREEKTVAGKESLFVQTTKEWQSKPFTSVFIGSDNKIYEIETNFVEGPNYEIYNQILSTFRFD